MTRPKVGLSVLLEDDLRAAQLPLFADGLVEAIEWTVDLGFDRPLPAWVDPLLDHYAASGALYGHGVHYSPLSAMFEDRQARWLEQLKDALALRSYRHVSEHFGFMTIPGVQRGAPLPVPFTAGAVGVGRDRLQRLADAAGLPVGLENLALAMTRQDVLSQGEFLEALLAPTDGFLLLDLHNLFCQAHNFDIAPDELMRRLPLERVREIHLSGGSWFAPSSDPLGGRFRRDTHDDDVPDEVFAMLEHGLARCPNLEVVFLERLGGTLPSTEAAARYASDFRRIRAIVDERPDGDR